MVSLPLFSPFCLALSLCHSVSLGSSVSLCLCLCLRGPIYSLKCFHIFTLSIESVPTIQNIMHIQVCKEISVSSQDALTVSMGVLLTPALTHFWVLFSQLLVTILQPVSSLHPL